VNQFNRGDDVTRGLLAGKAESWYLASVAPKMEKEPRIPHRSSTKAPRTFCRKLPYLGPLRCFCERLLKCHTSNSKVRRIPERSNTYRITVTAIDNMSKYLGLRIISAFEYSSDIETLVGDM